MNFIISKQKKIRTNNKTILLINTIIIVSIICINMGCNFRLIPLTVRDLIQPKTDICNLHDSITELRLDFQEWDSLPNCLGELKNLKYINLFSNYLEVLPDSFIKLRKLERLFLDDNKFSKTPIQILDIQSLELLSISGCNLKSIPTKIDKLTNLKALYLEMNDIDSIPESIGNLQKLKRLHLYDNELTELPESISKLSGTLKELHLAGNYIPQDGMLNIESWLPKTKIIWYHKF